MLCPDPGKNVDRLPEYGDGRCGLHQLRRLAGHLRVDGAPDRSQAPGHRLWALTTLPPPTMERLRGFQDAMMKHNLPIDQNYLLERWTASHILNRAPGQELCSRQPPRQRAFWSYRSRRPPLWPSTTIALSVYTECHRRMGSPVGKDISVVGYSDIPLTEILHHRRSLPYNAMWTMASTAISTLLDRLKSKNYGGRSHEASWSPEVSGCAVL